jgi:hypothetical protein
MVLIYFYKKDASRKSIERRTVDALESELI